MWCRRTSHDVVPIAPDAEPDPSVISEPDAATSDRAERAPLRDRGSGESKPPSDNWFYAALGVAAGLAIALVVWAIWPDPPRQLTRADVDVAVAEALAAQTPVPEPGPLAFEAIEPSLVVVRAVRDGENVDAGSGANIGGGVVVNERGQILTANHVVDGADSIELTFADGQTGTARLDGNSPALDIAVLSPLEDITDLQPAVLGNSRALRVGDPIYTVGNPLGLTSTISAGVVSGLGRSIPFPGETDLVLQDLIQFDAAVNHGSSGGPLLNGDGQVVGIVTSLADPAGQGFFIGIGFAVPIDVAAAGTTAAPDQ